MIDYHVHTLLCNHATGTMQAYIRRAIDLGLSDICFLDHLTLQPSESNPSSMNPSEVPLYFQALQFFKRQYQGIINVKIGLEVDFNPKQIVFFAEIIERFPFDVIGGSLHFPSGLNIASSGSAWRQGKLDPDYVCNLYLENLSNMLDYDYFDVVCHLDLIKKFGWISSKFFDKNFDSLLSIIKSKDLVLEINTSGYNHKLRETYPSPDMIKKCYQLGIQITLGSDAHKPADVGQHYDRVLPLLMDAGYRHLTTFTRRKRDFIAI